MKLLIGTVSLLAVANGFQVHTSSSTLSHNKQQTAVHAAAPPMSSDEWAKPLTQRASTTPVPVKKVTKAERSQLKDRIIDPDYTLAAVVALLGPLIAWYHPCKFQSGVPL
jgi:hypothetical protein